MNETIYIAIWIYHTALMDICIYMDIMSYGYMNGYEYIYIYTYTFDIYIYISNIFQWIYLDIMNELFYGSLRIIVVDIRLNGHYDWTLWIIVGHYDPYQQICGHYEWTGDFMDHCC